MKHRAQAATNPAPADQARSTRNAAQCSSADNVVKISDLRSQISDLRFEISRSQDLQISRLRFGRGSAKPNHGQTDRIDYHPSARYRNGRRPGCWTEGGATGKPSDQELPACQRSILYGRAAPR